MKKQLTITTHAELARQDRAFWLACTPEQRLDAVEILRVEAGNFLYEYPSRAGDVDFSELFQLLETTALTTS